MILATSPAFVHLGGGCLTGRPLTWGTATPPLPPKNA